MEIALHSSNWERLGKKLRERLDSPRFAGSFSAENSLYRNVRLVQGYSRNGVSQLIFYWLVDETDGVISDAKYQVFGPPGLIAAAECACDWLLRKNYDQAKRSTAELLDRHMRSSREEASFPDEYAIYLNMALDAIDCAAELCSDLPFEMVYDQTPLQDEIDGAGVEGWEEMPEEQKITLLEQVIDKEIRPYIELDAGGIQLLGMREGGIVRISYEGACTGCPSSVGSTLSAIERILRARLHRSISVIPE